MIAANVLRILYCHDRGVGVGWPVVTIWSGNKVRLVYGLQLSDDLIDERYPLGGQCTWKSAGSCVGIEMNFDLESKNGDSGRRSVDAKMNCQAVNPVPVFSHLS